MEAGPLNRPSREDGEVPKAASVTDALVNSAGREVGSVGDTSAVNGSVEPQESSRAAHLELRDAAATDPGSHHLAPRDRDFPDADERGGDCRALPPDASDAVGMDTRDMEATPDMEASDMGLLDVVSGQQPADEYELRPARRLRLWQTMPIAALGVFGSLMFAFPLAFELGEGGAVVAMLGLLLSASSAGWGIMIARRVGYTWPGLPQRGSGGRADWRFVTAYVLLGLVVAVLAVWRVARLH